MLLRQAVDVTATAVAGFVIVDWNRPGHAWRREWDSNPRYGFPYTRFPSERLQPLGHPSAGRGARNIVEVGGLTTHKPATMDLDRQRVWIDPDRSLRPDLISAATAVHDCRVMSLRRRALPAAVPAVLLVPARGRAAPVRS
jgi:hypothetical protein